MSIAIDHVLDGMPDPAHLHKLDLDGQVTIMVGDRQLFAFAATDLNPSS